MSGTTNALVAITELLKNNQTEAAEKQIRELHDKYLQVTEELFTNEAWKKQANALLNEHFMYLQAFTLDMFTSNEERSILAQGELLSTALFHYYLFRVVC